MKTDTHKGNQHGNHKGNQHDNPDDTQKGRRHREADKETPAPNLSQVVAPSRDLTHRAPRPHIRAYLHTLMAAIGQELPPTWPMIPAAAYHQLSGRLRSSIEQLISYTAQRAASSKTKRDEQISLRLLAESALALCALDWGTPESTHTASPETLAILQERPLPQIALDQLYCTPDSTERRAMAALRDLPPSDGQILFLGDDDLCSLVLAQRYQGELHVVDFDQRLLEHIQATAPALHCHPCDLVQGGLPKAFYQKSDIVLLDPPWDAYGAWNFIDKAILALKPSRHARILLSFCPLYLEYIDHKMDAFWRRLTARGFTCEQIEPAFHLYGLEGTEFFKLLQQKLPTFTSPLLDCLCQVPYGFSHLYTLRRIAHTSPKRIAHAWRRWWHTS